METGDRVGTFPPTNRLCKVFKTSLTDGQDCDAVTMSLKQISAVHDDATLGRTTMEGTASIRASTSGPNMKPQVLATNWGFDVRTATRTITATTQRGIRTVVHPTLSRRFRMNDQQLRYRSFTDTMFANTTSHRNKKKCAQAFATPDGWYHAYPSSTNKSLAH